MKRTLFIIGIAVFAGVIGSAGISYAADQTVKMDAEVAPLVHQTVGSTDAFALPGLWPQFSDPDWHECYGVTLEQGESCTSVIRGLSLTPRTQAQVGYDAQAWQDVMTSDEILIDSKLAKNGKILVSWTVRILAYPVVYSPYTVSAVPIGVNELNNSLPEIFQEAALTDPVLGAIEVDLMRGLCSEPSPCYTTFPAQFPGGTRYGKVYTRLTDMNGRALSREIAMTLPSSAAATSYDPTHSGSVLLTPDKFGGAFPEKIKFKIQWKNTTAFLLYSQAGMRSVIVTITRK